MTLEYNRNNVFEYARKWALKRNENYLNFDLLGGDCTNFASQCIYSGCKVMNYTKIFGWYYESSNNRSPSWTGVEYLYDFLISNNSHGPFATKTSIENLKVGDLIQLSFKEKIFSHSLIVIKISNPINFNNILIATHSEDSINRPLSTYKWNDIRFLHIDGVRK